MAIHEHARAIVRSSTTTRRPYPPFTIAMAFLCVRRQARRAIGMTTTRVVGEGGGSGWQSKEGARVAQVGRGRQRAQPTTRARQVDHARHRCGAAREGRGRADEDELVLSARACHVQASGVAQQLRARVEDGHRACMYNQQRQSRGNEGKDGGWAQTTLARQCVMLRARREAAFIDLARGSAARTAWHKESVPHLKLRGGTVAVAPLQRWRPLRLARER